MLPREFYEQQRKLGLTEDITGDPEPDYFTALLSEHILHDG